ncbi:hypothetical protein GUITHDRAFT_103276 [Guillardia theta CCMP2712]|uniref:DUF3598 domain-containing protein n=2 Tax=Guillardia theta TaxID=55529 RepID=L1JRG3_GUITC|nr:hypothetical protein GUITHDRAFT_103276 [Guillardia theta CCMP2712]EKX50683.1 hypothetical protein GUITHDRAFT_103276 [Guillardia theta CCMP2712]|eukprot:XP_005837663.1 hypothetical protein GUITHDRAFT_103276 [Guillardia theta CCMP2712]
MQWRESEERLPFQSEWEAFKNYNLGRWMGRALHISPQTGDYVPPFVTEHSIDVVQLEEGQQSAKQRLVVGNETSPRLSESVITVNDEFHCAEDGSYSYDSSLVSVPDVPGTARFCIEMSVALSEEERIRCLALYDFESKLSRIILYEEKRFVSVGANRLIGIKYFEDNVQPTRPPMTFLSLLGEYRGEAFGRGVARLGGGKMTFAARSGNQWDGTQKFRREMQVLDERNRVARKISWSDVNSPVEDSIIMDDGCKLFMLPSGCWVCLPEKLDKVSLDKVEKAEPDQSGGSKGDPVEAVKKALEAAFSTESDKNGDKLPGVQSFSAEFGCFFNDKELVRTIRMYNKDGRMASTTTLREKRVDSDGQSAEKFSSLSYDEFEQPDSKF